jgi:alpha-2-macroglobulin
MKRPLLFCSALLLALSANLLLAQNITWNSAPTTGFVFEISNNEAQKLLTKSRADTIINSLLHTQIDTFNVNKGWTHRPEKGHFILARIIENKLHCEYTSVFPYQVLLLKEYNALSLQVLDLEGNVREDAKVKFKTRRIRFDRESKTYRIENDWFNASSKIVTVELEGFRSVFNIEKHEVPSWANDYYNHDDGPDFYSYMITDKNRYKPGERVRFKSYALSGSRNPIRRDLEVWLIKSGKPVRLGTVTPHRPGSFAAEVHLHDSLKLTLDQYYTLQLWERSGRVVSNCSFKYEDYELHGNKLQVELETSRHFHPASNYVKITATSENGLILKDARATVAILTENIREIFQPLVVLPDTLMFKEIPLEGDDQTIVEIPSSLFQKSNTSYYVHVSVLNSQNQRMEKSVSAAHYFSQYELTAAYSNDSIVYQVLDKGSPVQETSVKVYRDGALEGVDMTLPYKEKINPATSSIRFESKLVSRSIRMTDMLPKLKFAGGIETDSFNISVENPQKIQLSWYIYQGSELLEKGSGPDVDFKSKIEDRSQTYYVELLYSFGGSDHITSKEFEFREGSLDVSLNLPDRVYPGQKVDATIDVTDDEGNPVSGVDLTALATTARLNYSVPDLPYYGSTSYPRSDKATYSRNEVNKRNAILDLDFGKWATRARLDTMKYYQFTYPGEKMFFHQTDIADSTQFAAYVVKDGTAKKVYVIEVDRIPVYYSWTDHPKGYSFYVEPEKSKHITLRLYDRVLILDSLCFDKGKKTIFSIDLDHLPRGVSVHNIDPETVRKVNRRKYIKWVFTRTEISRHNAYLAAFTEPTYPAYLTAGKQFVPLSAGGSSGRKLVVGPILPAMQTYTEHTRLKTTYRHAGGFSYSFEDNIVYKTEPPKLIPDVLQDLSFRPMTSINDVVINKKLLLEQEPYVPEKWHPRVIDLIDYACRIKVLLPFEEAQSGVASVLFRNCETNAVLSPCRDYTNRSDYFTIPRGYHHTIVLYNNGSYLKMDSINLRSYANIVADMKDEKLHAPDSTSRAWLYSGVSNCFRTVTVPLRTFTFQTSRDNIGNVHGSIFDDLNTPLPGATVVVKGTTIGAVSDINGRFVLDIPEDPSILVVSFIGYGTKEIEVRPGSEISVVMEADIQQLQEVVVVGYGEMQRQNLSASFAIRGASSLSGRVAGVTITQEGMDGDLETERQPGEEQNREAEQKLYQELLTLNAIRSQFSDVGFWEPRLFTDRHGRSTFAVTFPDDITRWDAVVYGMNRQLQTGTARKSIKSYKPLMAELHVPQFLTVGDSAHFLGKVLNYTSDKTIQGKVKWTGSATLEHDLSFDSYHTEKLPVVITSSDTVTTAYSFTRNNGYLDGEERKVPVIEQGTLRANGTLSMLQNNDELHMQSKKGTVVKMEIFDNQLDLYAQEVRYLLHYKYDCNEQLASKLIGLLNHKLLMQYEGKPFKYDQDVNKIIRRLLKNQNTEFLWSWWDVSSNTSYWMSAHILRALKVAKDAGYVVNLDLENVMRKATYKYEFLHNVSISDVQMLHALATWDARIDYARYVAILDRHIQYNDSLAREHREQYGYAHYSLLNEKLLLLEVRQLRKLPFIADSLLRYKKQTVLNEVYFSDDQPSRYWYSGDLSSNAIAYRIIKRDSTLKDLNTAMQMYFLSLRRKRDWNTYEASNVLMSILPDLIALGSTKKIPASISLKGKVNERIQKFPYRMELAGGEEVQLRKETGLPLYCMQYTEERVTKAQAGTDAFRIKNAFNQTSLKAGTPAILKATVEVKRDATLEYVMIEIPIPGGCSYADKRQFDNPIETHREYFKDRTVIFCENMTAGTYVFQVQLLPRFTGKYHVNPAQVSLMYFPVINANTDMEKVTISE